MQFIRPEIAAMAGYVPGEQPQEEGFIKLNTNENPYPPSPAVAGAIEEVLKRGLQKYPDPMGWRFRRAASEVLGVPPEWILCGNGSDDILTIATRTFVGQGQFLRLPYPSYILYRSLAEIQGARSEEVLFRPDWSLAGQFAAAGRRPAPGVPAQPEQPFRHGDPARGGAADRPAIALPAAWWTRRMSISPRRTVSGWWPSARRSSSRGR